MKAPLINLIKDYTDMSEVLYWEKPKTTTKVASRLTMGKATNWGKALILSRDKSTNKIFEFCFARQGLEPFTARSVQELVDLISSHRVDALLVDVDDFRHCSPSILEVIDQVIFNFGVGVPNKRVPVLAVSKFSSTLSPHIFTYIDFMGALRPSEGLLEIEAWIKSACRASLSSERHNPGQQQSL